jgi:hypothetical protein
MIAYRERQAIRRHTRKLDAADLRREVELNTGYPFHLEKKASRHLRRTEPGQMIRLTRVVLPAPLGPIWSQG